MEASMPNTNGGALDSFLTPEAMLTPGAAGAMTMMITNALGVSFATPRALTALILSFVFGLLVLVANKTLMVRGVFYVLNSLVIFCVANGANGIGAAQHASIALVSPAFAQTSSTSLVDLQATYKKLSDECDDLSKKISDAQNNASSKDEVLSLVSKRDDVQKKRTETLEKIVKAQTGTSLEDIKSSPNKTGPSSFFAPWHF
jgi:hypothetical protein